MRASQTAAAIATRIGDKGPDVAYTEGYDAFEAGMDDDKVVEFVGTYWTITGLHNASHFLRGWLAARGE